MPATPMYVELLVIGFGADVWFGFFLSWLLGTNWITESLINFKSYAVLVSAFVLSVTYAFGILMDKLSKFVLEKILDEEKEYFDKFASLLLSGNELVIADLTYVRSKVRILRASVLNFSLVTLFSMAFLWKYQRRLSEMPSPLWLVMAATLVAGIVFTILSFLMYRYNTKLYLERLDFLFEAPGTPSE